MSRSADLSNLSKEANVAFIGDSIFDNGVYVPYGHALKDIVGNFRPHHYRVFARDGAIVQDIPTQFLELRKSDFKPSHFVLSVGGNNALKKSDLLYSKLSLTDGLCKLHSIGIDFGIKYRSLVQNYFSGTPTILCTIWNPLFVDSRLRRAAEGALYFFNNPILQAGIDFAFPVIDLRSVCNDDSCYANDIEPSLEGVERIAKMVQYILNRHDFAGPSVTYTKKHLRS